MTTGENDARSPGGAEQKVHPDLNLLSAVADGILRGPERKAVLSHLADCDDCRRVAFLVQNTGTASIPKPKRLAARWPAALAASAALGAFLTLSSLWPPDREPVLRRSLVTDHAAHLSASLKETEPAPRLAVKVRTRPGARGPQPLISGSATRKEPATWITRRLVSLPRPLPKTAVKPHLSLSSDENARTAFIRPGSSVIAIPGLTTQSDPLTPMKTVSLKSVAFRHERASCDDTGASYEERQYCAALYNKKIFQYLAQTTFLRRESVSGDGSLSPGAGVSLRMRQFPNVSHH